MTQQPTFGRRASPPQPDAKRRPPRPIEPPEFDLSGHAWNDDSELRAWKGQRRQAMSRAMGWRRWAFIGAAMAGGIIRWQAHTFALQALGVGLSLVGLVCLWAGRRRYAESL